MTDQRNTREIVLDMLLEVIEGDKFSHTVLGNTLKRYQGLERMERAFISRLFAGTVKQYLTLDFVINSVASLPVRKMKPFIRNLLRLSVYQILYMDLVPESAVCNEAVKLAKKRGFSKLSGFVNAVLRNIIREKDRIEFPGPGKDLTAYLSIRYSVPDWLVGQLIFQYGSEKTEAMLSASLKEKETTIRCNLTKTDPVRLKEILAGEGVTAEEHPYLKEAFILKDYDYLEKLEAFRQGLFTVQDVSSMLVCEAAGIGKKDFVVDVCAAPGGKALHAAERAMRVSARDLTDHKVKLMNDNIRRLGITNVETKVWDATVTDPTVLHQADVLIADLPCSGLGVLGKKYDIKYKLTQNQQKDLIELQRKILSAVSEYVKPGGILMYSTCTVNMEENLGNMGWFLNNYDFATESLDPYLPPVLYSKSTMQGYLQLLQGIHPTDGFFLCRLRKR